MGLKLYEVNGIDGKYQLAVNRIENEMQLLTNRVPVDCTTVHGKQVDASSFAAQLVKLSRYCAHLQSGTEIEMYSDLRIQLGGKDGHVYGKVLERTGSEGHFLVNFSSLSPTASDLIAELMRECG